MGPQILEMAIGDRLVSAARAGATCVLAIASILATGCLEAEHDRAESPRCSIAVARYYVHGCRYTDIRGGFADSLEDTVETCNFYDQVTPRACRPEFDAWKACINAGTRETGCDCTDLQIGLLACAAEN